MRKGKFREQEIDIFTKNKYYEIVFYTLLEKTAESIKLDKQELLVKWCDYTQTDFNLLSRAIFKLGFATHIHLKYLTMEALSYFGVTVKDIKEVFGITANYCRIKQPKIRYNYNTCSPEEHAEMKKLIDRLIYLLYFFKYIKYNENEIVLKDYKELNKQRILELYVRNTIFYYNKRFKNLFPDRVDKPTWTLGKMLSFNSAELDFVNSKTFIANNITLGEMRSLLYYAFGISIEDAKEFLPNTIQNINYLHKKYKDRHYLPKLNADEFEVIERFLKVVYNNTKYICCLKGEP